MVGYYRIDYITTSGNTTRSEQEDLAGISHSLFDNQDSDDHLQYVPRTGSRGFTGTVSGIYPTQDSHLATKQYVDGNDIFTLLGLTDTPDYYDEGRYLKSTASGTNWAEPNFLELTDTPTTYSGHDGDMVTVISGGNRSRIYKCVTSYCYYNGIFLCGQCGRKLYYSG